MATTEKLTELTPEHEALMDVVFAEYDRVLDVRPEKPTADMVQIRAWLSVVYGLYDAKVPDRIEIVDSPDAAFTLEKELTGSTDRILDDCGIGDSGWVSFYDMFQRIGVLTAEENADVIALRDFQRCAWDTVLLDECAIVIAHPTVKRDAEGRLHCEDGPAAEWIDGRADYSWHGVWVPAKAIASPDEFTADEYRAITDTEVRRAVGEKLGWSRVVELLGAKTVNVWIDPSTALRYELLSSDSGERWIRKLSPALQDGSAPTYTEPVHEDLTTAQAARKWQACGLAAESCNQDPELSYGVEA